jgi:hypothetical protein
MRSDSCSTPMTWPYCHQRSTVYRNNFTFFSITWANNINSQKTKVVIFQKKARNQSSRHSFKCGNTVVNGTTTWVVLLLGTKEISASDGFGLAVNALFRSEVWGSTCNCNYKHWEKTPIEDVHTEFCRIIRNIRKKVPNNACRAELGRLPLIVNI